MKLWQWFACWLAFEVAKKQAWIDAPQVQAWAGWTLFVVVLAVHFGARAFGKEVTKIATLNKPEAKP